MLMLIAILIACGKQPNTATPSYKDPLGPSSTLTDEERRSESVEELLKLYISLQYSSDVKDIRITDVRRESGNQLFYSCMFRYNGQEYMGMFYVQELENNLFQGEVFDGFPVIEEEPLQLLIGGGGLHEDRVNRDYSFTMGYSHDVEISTVYVEHRNGQVMVYPITDEKLFLDVFIGDLYTPVSVIAVNDNGDVIFEKTYNRDHVK